MFHWHTDGEVIREGISFDRKYCVLHLRWGNRRLRFRWAPHLNPKFRWDYVRRA